MTLAGCSDMSQREQRALSGGAVIGAMAGSPAIGGAAGAATGALWDDIKKRVEQ